jgi:hypothetical protein
MNWIRPRQMVYGLALVFAILPSWGTLAYSCEVCRSYRCASATEGSYQCTETNSGGDLSCSTAGGTACPPAPGGGGGTPAPTPKASVDPKGWFSEGVAMCVVQPTQSDPREAATAKNPGQRDDRVPPDPRAKG